MELGLFERKKYSIIYADPSWKFNDTNTGGSYISGAENKYKVMTLADLKKLPVRYISETDCVLFMWWVASQPQEALDLVKAWGFTIKNMNAFVWVKKTKHGKEHFGMGHYTRAGSESCLVAIKGNPIRVNASVRSVVYATVGEHSEKPAQVRDDIVTLMGDVPRIELFARGPENEGWDQWGNEAYNSVEL